MSDKTSDKRLLPCPFCGGEASLSNEACKRGDDWLWSIECIDCGAFMSDEYEQHVVNWWNTRKPVERIVKRFEDKIAESPDASLANYRAAYYEAIDIVKEGMAR